MTEHEGMEARRELMRVQKFLRRGEKISSVNAVAICGALSDAYAEGYREGIEAAAKVAEEPRLWAEPIEARDQMDAQQKTGRLIADRIRQLSQEGPQR